MRIFFLENLSVIKDKLKTDTDKQLPHRQSGKNAINPGQPDCKLNALSTEQSE